MVVCHYFLQGTCKFGTYCRYDHQLPSNYIYTNFSDASKPSTSILRQTSFNAQPAPKTGPENFQSALRFAIHEVTGAEKGGQWLLSTFAPFKEKPALPGFEDHSQEEIRLAYYEAVKNGTVEQYKQQLQQLYQATLVKMRAIENPSAEIKTMLHSIFQCAPASLSGTYGQDTISTAVSPIQQTSNIFAAQNVSPFGQASNAFAANPQPVSNIFAATPTTNIFAAPQAQANIFATSPQSQNMFGGAAFPAVQKATQQTNIFANSGQTAQPVNMGFANQPGSIAQQSGNIFATGSQSSQLQNAFAAQNTMVEQQQPQNVFAASRQTVFGGPQQSSFGATSNSPLAAQSTAAASNYSASIFGQPAPQAPSGSFGPVDAKLYSDPAELSEKEQRWFASDELDIMNIPDKPPAYNMCFGQ